jgi:hypothetical protein
MASKLGRNILILAFLASLVVRVSGAPKENLQIPNTQKPPPGQQHVDEEESVENRIRESEDSESSESEESSHYEPIKPDFFLSSEQSFQMILIIGKFLKTYNSRSTERGSIKNWQIFISKICSKRIDNKYLENLKFYSEHLRMKKLDTDRYHNKLNYDDEYKEKIENTEQYLGEIEDDREYYLKEFEKDIQVLEEAVSKFVSNTNKGLEMFQKLVFSDLRDFILHEILIENHFIESKCLEIIPEIHKKFEKFTALVEANESAVIKKLVIDPDRYLLFLHNTLFKLFEEAVLNTNEKKIRDIFVTRIQAFIPLLLEHDNSNELLNDSGFSDKYKDLIVNLVSIQMSKTEKDSEIWKIKAETYFKIIRKFLQQLLIKEKIRELDTFLGYYRENLFGEPIDWHFTKFLKTDQTKIDPFKLSTTDNYQTFVTMMELSAIIGTNCFYDLLNVDNLANQLVNNFENYFKLSTNHINGMKKILKIISKMNVTKLRDHDFLWFVFYELYNFVIENPDINLVDLKFAKALDTYLVSRLSKYEKPLDKILIHFLRLEVSISASIDIKDLSTNTLNERISIKSLKEK